LAFAWTTTLTDLFATAWGGGQDATGGSRPARDIMQPDASTNIDVTASATDGEHLLFMSLILLAAEA
jgi:hypothetical protein